MQPNYLKRQVTMKEIKVTLQTKREKRDSLSVPINSIRNQNALHEQQKEQCRTPQAVKRGIQSRKQNYNW